jgi:DNA-binding PadR family transcriptional regulator
MATTHTIDPASDRGEVRRNERAGQDLTTRSYWAGTIKMSLSKLFILAALAEGPRHGYEVARRVLTMTNGCCSPTEGTIYPSLRDLEAGGYVTAEEAVVGGRRRKVYTMTARGRVAHRVAMAAWTEAAEALTGARRALAVASANDVSETCSPACAPARCG